MSAGGNHRIKRTKESAWRERIVRRAARLFQGHEQTFRATGSLASDPPGVSIVTVYDIAAEVERLHLEIERLHLSRRELLEAAMRGGYSSMFQEIGEDYAQWRGHVPPGERRDPANGGDE